MNESPILGGVHTVENIDTAGRLYPRKHVPFVAFVREGDVVTITVEVGHYVAHPTADHWIELVESSRQRRADHDVDFAAGVVAPKVTCVAARPGNRSHRLRALQPARLLGCRDHRLAASHRDAKPASTLLQGGGALASAANRPVQVATARRGRSLLAAPSSRVAAAETASASTV